MKRFNDLAQRNVAIGHVAITFVLVALLSACGSTPYVSTAPTFNTNNAKLAFDNKPLENTQSLGRVTLNSRNVGFTQSETGSLALGVVIPLFGAAANAAYVTGLTQDKGEVLDEIAKLDLAELSSLASLSFCQTFTCEVVGDAQQADLLITPAVSMFLKPGDKDLITSVLFYVRSKSDPKWQGRYLVKLPDVLDYEKFKHGDNSQVESYKAALTRGYESLFGLFVKDLQGLFNYASKETVVVEAADNEVVSSGKLLQQDKTVLVIDTFHGIQSIDVSEMKVRKI